MKRELLFDAVRDEQGDLFLEVTGTDITIYMSVACWKEVIERFQKSATTDAAFGQEDLGRKDEVIDILKQAVRKQEEEEEEAKKRA